MSRIAFPNLPVSRYNYCAFVVVYIFGMCIYLFFNSNHKFLFQEKNWFNLEAVVLDFLYKHAENKRATVWDLDIMGENSDRPDMNKWYAPAINSLLVQSLPA